MEAMPGLAEENGKTGGGPLDEIARDLGVHPRWLPQAEHAEKIREQVRSGICYIEHRGHRSAPLLVFNDGGSMELPTVRWMHTLRGMCLVSVGEKHAPDQTTYYDVCGTVDAIRKSVSDGEDLTPLLPLLDDIETMIRRMASRRGAYDRFVSAVLDTAGDPVRRKEVDPVYPRLAELRDEFRRPSGGRPREEAEKARIVDAAEAVRDVAQYLEYSLSDCRAIAVAVYRLYVEIRGGRDWSKDEGA